MSFLLGLLLAAIPGTAALLLPALGELITERAGVVNLGTEGAMLSGALTSVLVTLATGSLFVGVVAGFVAGVTCGLLHAWVVLFRGANQLATGLVVWFLAVGVTSVIGAPLNGQVVDPLPSLAIPGLSALPGLGGVFDQNLLVYLAFALVPALWWFMDHTRPGLLLRAAGERPAVVYASGSHPLVIRTIAVAVGAGLAGLGGTQLAVGIVGNWTTQMTNGYGFVAVAVVIFARWKPGGVLLGSLLFGVSLALAATVQARGIAINQYLLDALPYLITLVVLILASFFGRSEAPESQRDSLSQIG